MRWIKLDTGFLRNPKIRRAGRDARDVFLALLLLNGEHEFDGVIPAQYVDPEYLARDLDMSVDMVRAALERLLAVGCVTTRNASVTTRNASVTQSNARNEACNASAEHVNDLLIDGWCDEWRPRVMTNAERQELYRKRTKNATLEPGVTKSNEAVTKSNAVTGEEENREEEKRGKKRGEKAPVKRAPPDRRLFTDEFQALYQESYNGAKPTWGAVQIGIVDRLLATHGWEECRRRMRVYFRAAPEWIARDGLDIKGFMAHFDKLAAPVVARTGGARAEQLAWQVRELERGERDEGFGKHEADGSPPGGILPPATERSYDQPVSDAAGGSPGGPGNDSPS